MFISGYKKVFEPPNRDAKFKRSLKLQFSSNFINFVFVRFITKAINYLGMINTSREKYLFLFCHEKKETNIFLLVLIISKSFMAFLLKRAKTKFIKLDENCNVSALLNFASLNAITVLTFTNLS